MNVVCICLDTLRADIVGEGKKYSHIRTPNLDAFAADSIRFTRAFGECQPTLQMRRGLFTGQRSFPFRYNFDRRGHWPHFPGWHKIDPARPGNHRRGAARARLPYRADRGHLSHVPK